ncbi:putative Kinase interacting family protein [Melia azedarach]|uniref:Kinase interacting family protein n=1 Tax=Melia azedarach TaxID=155640 RepID=A0ACC1WQL1_MELAZ|nr:putative Kinase interacting family protein [Melia azedarach]
MEEKVGEMLKIIDDDGDSFAQRAEMYYRKRPELVGFVEETYRSYRALAERYDHLSKELQSANRTIATVFPEQVQFAMDAEDEENQSEASTSSTAFKPVVPKSKIPKVPAIPKKDFFNPAMRISKKGLKRTSSSAKAVVAPKSGLSKTEAFEEIDMLQKGILSLQTEKEFVKSSYERGYEKYWQIENQITEMQARVCSLQDEFGIGTVIDDNEARTLMAATAVKSCQETLAKLQDKHEQSVGEAKEDYQRILEAHQKFANLRNQFLCKQTDEQEPMEELDFVNAGSELKDLNPQICLEQAKIDAELMSKKKEELAADLKESLTVTQLAEKIDELVDKVVGLESSVSSQVALVKRLRSETDHLEANIRSLEGDKEFLIAGSDDLRNKLRALEDELRRIKSLNQSFEDQKNNLHTNFSEASYDIDYLSEKLQNGKIEEDAENARLFKEVKTVSEAKAEKEVKEQEDRQASGDSSVSFKDTETEQGEKKNDTSDPSISINPEEENNDSGTNDKSDVMSENPQEITHEEKDEKKLLSETASTNLDSEQDELGTEEGEEIHNWRQLSSGLEDREKILLEEYTSVLHSYKDVKRKLGEVEKKNRDGFIELALQIRELENAVAFRDEEIQTLRHKLTSSRTNINETTDGSLTASQHECQQEGFRESITQTPGSHFSSLGSNQQPAPSSEQSFDDKERNDLQNSPKREENKVNIRHVRISRTISPIEEKIRSDIDELLEENLEFWLRFSTSIHQVQKYQTTVQDLKAELAKQKYRRKQEGSTSTKQKTLCSDARPIYKHLREIQTELTLWLENNEVLKDEVEGRYSSLCTIQEEISRIATTNAKAEENEISNYQAAKFQGEVLNMKQENSKIADELHAGLDRVKQLRVEVEKTLAKLDGELRQHASMRSSSSRSRIPLHSFLFGVKLKKQVRKPSLFSCMNPTLQKQYSDLAAAGRPQDR